MSNKNAYEKSRRVPKYHTLTSFLANAAHVTYHESQNTHFGSTRASLRRAMKYTPKFSTGPKIHASISHVFLAIAAAGGLRQAPKYTLQFLTCFWQWSPPRPVECGCRTAVECHVRTTGSNDRNCAERFSRASQSPISYPLFTVGFR